MAKGKRIDIQTLERGQHEDLTRGDAFTMASVLEIARGVYDDRRWPMNFPGTVQSATGAETPMRGHVLSGLLVRPDNNTYLTVDAGLALLAVTAASSDDSVLELVNDPGVSTAGTLPFVVNPAGGVRLDIVEVSVVDTALETVTRGIFNSATRVFDPTSVPKVNAPILSYRIRQGVAGSGLPALVAGWLPLAVICHQPSTASFADCDMWDVRPLVSDLVQQGTSEPDPNGAVNQFESPIKGRWRQSVAKGLQGYAVGQFNGYIAGGQLIASTAFPLADRGNFIDSFAPTYGPNSAPGFSFASNTMVHVAACFPAGLPRWVKYIDSAAAYGLSARVPKGPRGILVVTSAQPQCNGRYAGLTLPSASGFTSGAPGVALATLGVVNGGARPLSAACVGEHVTFEITTTLVLPGIAGVGSNQVSWTFSPNAGAVIPAHAKSIDVTFDFLTTTDGVFEVFVKRANAEEEIFHQWIPVAVQGTGGKFTLRGIPISASLPWDADAGGLPAQTYIRLSSLAAMTACVAYLGGYST